jgi:hypothetical protein
MRALAVALLVPALLGVPAALVPAPAQAGGGHQCLPHPQQESLVVKGQVSCGKVKGFLPQARELAKTTEEYGYERFTIKGFICELGRTPRQFDCEDIDGKPERSFRYRG